MIFDESSYVIIGNGAAGYYAADSIRKNDKESDIHIISEEKILTYFRPQLSKFLGFPIDNTKFFLSPENWYKDNNINITLNKRVKKINIDNNLLLLDDGSIIGYKKLILANGSHNFMPPLTGIDKVNVFSLRTINDAEKIKEHMSQSKNVVIVGGGLLGLEAAWSMKNVGLNVTVLEHSSRLLSRQVDEEGAKILRNSIDKTGIKIMVNADSDELLGDKKVTGLKLKSGEILPADIVLFSTGIRPNKDLPKQSGITVDKGIIVNDRMETNAPNVYACGDVAEFNGKVFGNWPAAMNMGKVAGSNAAGAETYFKEFVPSVFFDSMNINLFSCGNFDETNEQLVSKDLSNNSYMKFYFKSDKIIGGFLIGDTKKAAQLLNAIKKGMSFDEVKTKFNL